MRPKKTISDDARCQEGLHVWDNQGICWHCGQIAGVTVEEWEALLEARDAAKIKKWAEDQL